MSPRSKNHQRLVLGLLAILPLAAHAACASSNGDAVGSQTYDASPLDPGQNPGDPDGSIAQPDSAAPSDAARLSYPVHIVVNVGSAAEAGFSTWRR